MAQCSYPPHWPWPSLMPCELWLDPCVLLQRTIFLFSQESNLLSFVAEEPHCLSHAAPWSLDICSTQHSPVHRMGMHCISNRHTHLYPPLNNSSVHLTTTTYVQRSGRITGGMWSGWTTPRDSVLSSLTPASALLEWPCQEQHGSTTSAPVSVAPAPACTNGVYLLLRPVSVAQKNRPSTMSSSIVQSIDLHMDCSAWRFWMMRYCNWMAAQRPSRDL